MFFKLKLIEFRLITVMIEGVWLFIYYFLDQQLMPYYYSCCSHWGNLFKIV